MVFPGTLKNATAMVIVVACTLSVSACQTVDRTTTGSIARPGGKSVATMTVPELKRAIDKYGRLYAKKPKDKTIGLTYAKALGTIGRADQSLAVMQQVAIAHPKDNEVLGEYGKALAASGNLSKALETIERAQRPDYPDWKLLSANGAILDQMGKPEEARKKYRKAMDIAPNEPSILSNIGMSYILAGDLRAAETYLAKANRMPGADGRVRQNLALVVGLQGRFDEAKRIASADLPPAQAQENIRFLQKMLSQKNAWQQLKKEG